MKPTQAIVNMLWMVGGVAAVLLVVGGAVALVFALWTGRLALPPVVVDHLTNVVILALVTLGVYVQNMLRKQRAAQQGGSAPANAATA